LENRNFKLSVKKGTIAVKLADSLDEDFSKYLENTKKDKIKKLLINQKNLEKFSKTYSKKKIPFKARFDTGLVSNLNHRIQNTVEYPPIAEELGWNGNVKLLVEIKKDGSVGKIKILESSYSVFVSEAVEKVRKWKFQEGNCPEFIVLNFEFINKSSKFQ
jgi:TonB family protein